MTAPGMPPRRPLAFRLLRTLASVAAVAGLLLVALPRLSGIPWREVATAVQHVPWVDLALLTALWASGLVIHTVTLTAALPRLTHRRALALSLTGSAVANLLPFGGAAGVALNYRMSRTWGFSGASFAVYTMVTNVWDVLVKLCLPAAALGWLLLTGSGVVGRLVNPTEVATVVLIVLALVGAAVVASVRTAAVVAGSADLVISLLLRAIGSPRVLRPGQVLLRLRGESATLVAQAWPRLTLGMVAYTASLALLLGGCLHATGAGLLPAEVFAGFALERVLTLTGVTPGGVGVVEAGLTGLLLALGGDPVGTVTGVLLYRMFTYGLEIPVGGVSLAAWLWAHRRDSAPEQAVS